MKARVTWVEGRTFLGESGSGHTVVMDGAPEHGGRNLAVRPMEMLLLGLGGCATALRSSSPAPPSNRRPLVVVERRLDRPLGVERE